MDLVAGVHRDQQRGQRLGDARHLEAAAVHAAQAVDPLDQAAPPRACPRASRRTAARPARAGGRDRLSEAALTVCSAETTRTPSGAISSACWAAEPCHTPSMRVALPPTAAASGTVASISSWPGRERVAEVGERLGLVAERHAQDHRVAAARTAPALSWAEKEPLGDAPRARARRSRSARAASREPIAIGTPARASLQREAEAERAGGADDATGSRSRRQSGGVAGGGAWRTAAEYRLRAR